MMIVQTLCYFFVKGELFVDEKHKKVRKEKGKKQRNIESENEKPMIINK